MLIYPPGPDMGKRFALTRNEIVLGRGADCDIQVDRDSVSRRHARVFRTGESWSVEDLQSTNGSLRQRRAGHEVACCATPTS